MNAKEMTKVCAQLKSGMTVNIDGLPFTAHAMNRRAGFCACCLCNVDSACRGNIRQVCEEMDECSPSIWYLELLTPEAQVEE